MLSRGDAISIKPVASVEAPAAVAPIGDARQEAFQRAVQLTVGQKLQGAILSRMQDGSFLVRVAGTAARMMLPTDTKVGGTVSLTLMSMEPRPTFALGADDTELSSLGKLGESALQNAQQNGKLGKSAQLVYLDLHAGAESDETVKLGTSNPSSGHIPTKSERLIDNFRQVGDLLISPSENEANSAVRGKPLLNAADAEALLQGGKDRSSAPAAFSSTGKLINQLIQTAQQNGAPTSLKSQTPLLSSANANPTQVATALHDTLSFSGLFYEAHVGEWADGKRSMTDLMREPQAQLSSQTSDPRLSGLADNANVALAQLVNQQLNALEHHRASWHGEIWPGQSMEWDVEKEQSENSRGLAQDESKQTWHSSVRFELPTLGVVSATIQLIGEHVQIQVRTANETTALSLRAFAGQLGDALGAAGTQLDQLTVKQDDRV